MARLLLLFAVLNWLAAAYPQGQLQQHVLTEESTKDKPVPLAAEIVRKKLKKAEIIPTVIDDFSPSVGLHATWHGPGWPGKERAYLGNTLKPEQLQHEPTIALHDMQASSYPSSHRADNISYVITFTDPDAPSRDHPKWSEYCHWIASGVLKPVLCDPKEPAPCPPVLTDLDEVVPYKPPGPPEKTGKHRYVLLVFIAGNGTTDKLHLSKPSGRKHWGYDPKKGSTKGVREWAEHNGLVPVGANFIYAKHKKQ